MSTNLLDKNVKLITGQISVNSKRSKALQHRHREGEGHENTNQKMFILGACRIREGEEVQGYVQGSPTAQ